MALLQVLTYPDPRLKQVAAQVTEFNDPLRQLAADMAEAMYAESGVGLAAPQVGVSLRLFVADCNYGGSEEDDDHQWEAYINPVISNGQGHLEMEEGCLSVPEVRATLDRFETLTLDYQDLDGNPHQVEAEGLFALCIQHETDHLEGKLFIDFLPPLRRKMVKNRLKKLARAHD
ncbi:MAG: peptide deformylase [bacterium]|nr:peptide deformylase [bacterium]